MNHIGLVTAAGIKNVLRMKVGLAILLSITLICVVGVAYLMCVLLISPEVARSVPDKSALENNLSLILYCSTLISIGVTLNSLVFQTMIREKSRGNLAALMATPLKVSEIWLGKSLSLFLPGLVLGILLTVFNLLIINFIYFLPNDIGFIFSLNGAVSSLIAGPLMYLFFGVFVHLIGLITKSATGNVVAQVFLPVIANVIIQFVGRDVMKANSWQFMVMNLGLSALLGVIILVMRSRLTAERVILSAS